MTLLTMMAISMVNIPYIWGGNSPLTGLDCSGSVQIPLKKLGILDSEVDYWSQSIYNELIIKGFASSEPSQDCILFFGKATDKIKHVAVAISPTWMIEAKAGGRTIISVEKAIEMQAFVDFGKINRRSDLVSCIKIKY